MSNVDLANDDGETLAGGDVGSEGRVDLERHPDLFLRKQNLFVDLSSLDEELERLMRGIKCDENCGRNCTNSTLHISNLPLDVTTDELRELFGRMGEVQKLRQKRVYEDQWPWNIKINIDEHGNNTRDAFLSYENPETAHRSGSYYNGYVMRGSKINVKMAEKSPPIAPATATQHGYGFGDGNRNRVFYGDYKWDSYGGYMKRDSYDRCGKRDRKYGYGYNGYGWEQRSHPY